MKVIIPLLTGVLVLSGAMAALAGGEAADVEKKIVIALSTDDFEIEETDLSHLAVGDAETIVTEDGKTIDMLRTEDGIEVYVDGELLDMGHGEHAGHHVMHRIEIFCEEGEEECEEMEWISEDGDVNLTTHLESGHKVIMIKGDEEAWDVETLTEVDGNVHIVKKIAEDAELDELHEASEHDVIIIRKKVEDEI